MSAEYIKAFIIGSSWPAFVSYFYAVSHYDKTIRNYSFKEYVIVAPLFLGLLNMFGLFISKEYNLSRDCRFLLTGLIGATIISILITVTQAYNFKTKKRWIEQYISLFLVYTVTFFVIINSIDYYLDGAIIQDNISHH